MAKAHARVAVIVLALGVGSVAAAQGQGAERQAAIVSRARLEVARGVIYDPSYFRLSFRDEADTGRSVYPGGDLDPSRGVCTDVVIRSMRAVGVDLQDRVHKDILARPLAYTTVTAPDANIDHRRVGPLLTYLKGHATAVSDADVRAGDIVVFAFHACPACTPDHIGIVSDKLGPRARPLVIHNVGPKPSEDDVLDSWTRLGVFRL
jgi:uncharacterized protein YijF (DUF1287 family)